MIKLSEFTKLRATMLAVHCGAAVGLILFWDPRWFALSFVCSFLFLWIGQEMYCHRYLCHRSFKMSPLVQKICAILSIYNLYGNPIGIAATHATHHKYSDTDKDPHPSSTPLKSWFWVSERFDKSIDPGTAKRLMKDPLLSFIAKYYLIIYIVSLFAVGLVSAKILVYGFLVTHVYAFAANGLVTVFCHGKGYRTHDTRDTSTNNHWVNLALFGNGVAMHNNHHASPTRFTNSEKWTEVDIIGFIIRLLFKKENAI